MSQKFKNDFIEALSGVYGEREAGNMYKLYAAENSQLIAESDVSAEASNKILADVEKLRQHYPIQYLLGKTWFFDIELSVGPGALIPRPETEEMVDLILRENHVDSAHVLDVGTGSGCIPLVLKTKKPGWSLVGLDISNAALRWAKLNARKMNLEVSWSEVNILESPPPEFPFDIIVSNPPYISPNEVHRMSPSAAQHEPPEALFADDPLQFYRRLVEKMNDWLKPEGKLYCEISEYRSEDLKFLLEKQDRCFRIEKDMSGKDRFLIIENKR